MTKRMRELHPAPLPDNRLALVAPGPDAVLTPAAELAFGEWIAGWIAEKRLERASIPRPGPMLLHGPPGTGKTTVTRAAARRFEDTRRVYAIDGMRMVGSLLGESSSNLVAAADAARRAVPTPVLVFEEVDTLASIRSYRQGGDVENSRATTAIMRLLEHPGPSILTSNRLDVLDPAVVRRCEYVIEMPEPSPEAKRTILTDELGADPGGHVGCSLVVAVPIARRARRVAFLERRQPAEVFAALLEASNA